jgi:hypothetical protein
VGLGMGLFGRREEGGYGASGFGDGEVVGGRGEEGNLFKILIIYYIYIYL